MGRTPSQATAQPRVMQAKKREAQDRVLGLLAQGHTVKAAMVSVGRKEETYYVWRQDNWFKERADTVRHRPSTEKRLSIIQLRKLYFGHDTPRHQERIYEAMDSAQPGSITMILEPPGGGKTTALEDFYNIKLGEDPNWRFCVISEAQALGRKILGHVKDRMEDRTQFAAYIDRYGPFKAPDRELNRPWNADYIKVVQANSGERDYSLEVKGAGSKIYGAQFDDIVLDDIQSTETLNKTDALMEYFRNTLYSRMMRANSKGRIFIIGTRVGPNDFYEELLKLDIDINLVKVPALIEHPDTGDVASYFPPIPTSDGELIGFSLEDLQSIEKVVGPDAWSRSYMQEPTSRKGRTFSEDMLTRSLDDKRTVSDTSPPGMFRMGSLDPALGGHTVLRIGAMDFEHLWMLDGKNEEGLARYEEIYEMVDNLSLRWKPNVWIIEGNAIQKGILKDDRMLLLASKHGFRIEAHQTGHNKTDMMIGIPSMVGPFLRGEISIPNGDEESKQCFRPMLEDLRRWRPDMPSRLLQQDEVMALWFQYLYWQRTKSELALSIPTHIKRPGMPFKPTKYPVGAARG